MPAAPIIIPPPNATEAAAMDARGPTFICHLPNKEADRPCMIKTRERGKAVSINDQSAAAGATIPISLVVTSAINDQAYGAPRHICVVKAGITISHLLVNVGDATFDSGPKSLAKRLFGSAATGLVASLEVSVLVEN